MEVSKREDDAPGAPEVEHRDVTIQMPRGKKLAVAGVREEAALRLYFDGRSADK